MKSIFVISLLALVLCSCGPTPMYEKTYDFRDHEWSGGESPSYTFNAKDTTIPYNFILSLRTTSEFTYSNIWVFMYTKNPDKTTRKDTLNFPIAQENGQWIGKNSGSIIENEFLIGLAKKFPQKGEYTIRFEQAITEPIVPEVLDLTLEIIETDK